MKRTNLKNRTFYFKMWRGKKLARRFMTHKLGRFSFNLMGLAKLQPGEKVYIKVVDGFGTDNWGRRRLFYNDGLYSNYKELLKAYYSFIE